MSMAFIGGLFQGGLDARQRRQEAEADLTKSLAGKGLTAEGLKKELAMKGYPKIAQLRDVNDINALTSILGMHNAALEEIKTQGTLSTQRTTQRGDNNIALAHSDLKQNIVIPNLNKVIQSLGYSAATAQEAKTDLAQSVNIANSMYQILDRTLSSDSGISINNLSTSLSNRIDDLTNQYPLTPTFDISVSQGLPEYFPNLHNTFKNDPERLKAIEDVLVKYNMFQPNSDKLDNQAVNTNVKFNEEDDDTVSEVVKQDLSLENAIKISKNNPKIVTVNDLPETSHKAGPHSRFILTASDPEQANAEHNKDEKGAIPRYGLATINNRLQNAIKMDVAVTDKYNDLAIAIVNPTSEASGYVRKVSSFALLRDALAIGPLNRTKVTHYKARGKNTVHQHTYTEAVPKKVKEKEEEKAKPLMRQSASLNGARSVINDVELLAQHVGIMLALSEAPAKSNLSQVFGGDVDATELSHISGKLLKKFINDANSIAVVNENGTTSRLMTKNNFHNILLSAIAAQDKEIGNHFARKGAAAAIGGGAAATGSFVDNLVANVSGILTTMDSYLDRTETLYKENNAGNYARAKKTLSDRGINFDEQIAGERARMAQHMQEYNKAGATSRQKALAYARAQMSFYKINLAYQYAAISQGGEGSARTISDTDFAKNYLALFQESGESFLGVVSVIQRQTRIQLEANRLLMSEIGKGRYNKLYPEINNLGLSLNYQHSIKDKRVSPKRINTIYGDIQIGKKQSRILRDVGVPSKLTDQTDLYSNFNSFTNRGTTNTRAATQREGSKSFNFDFEKPDMETAFKASAERDYFPEVKKQITKVFNAPKWGEMEPDRASALIKKNRYRLYEILFSKPSLEGSGRKNPFNFVRLQNIEGFKTKFPDKEVGFILRDWQESTGTNPDKFALLQQGRLHSVFPLEKERLKGEEFILDKISDIVLKYVYKNWKNIR